MAVRVPGEIWIDHLFRWAVVIGISLLIVIYGRNFLIPLVVAFLIFTVVSGAISKVRNLQIGTFRLPYWLGATLGLLTVSLGMFALYSILSAELLLVIAEWPTILERFQALIETLSIWFGEDVTESILLAYGDFNVAAGLRGLIAPAGFAVTTIIVIALYVTFMFIESAHVPEKLEHLFPGRSDTPQIVEVSRQIVEAIHRYLLLTTLISAVTAALVYALLKAAGLEFAEILALLTFFLNFIPNIGSITSTVVPTLFAILQFQEPGPVVLVGGGLTLIQFLVGQIFDPMIMGRTLNLSSFVIILSLTFWATVWGIAGMFLAVPIMVMIMIVCSKLPSLRPVAIILSSDGNLDVDMETAT
jgi:AI-2 transport protein TqsA